MGRGKLDMKLIENETTRAKTFRKRMQALEKKAYEFSTLCDVKVCMIVFKPELKHSPAKLEVWPSDPVEVRSIVDKFMISKPIASHSLLKRSVSVNDFLNVERDVGNEVAKVRKANLKAKFPTWDDSIYAMNLEQIASFLTKLDANLEAVNRKMMAKRGALPKPKSDHMIPSAFPPTNQNHSDYSHMFKADHAAAPAKSLNYFDDIQLPSIQKKLGPAIPAKPLSIRLPSHSPSPSPADEALVKLSLGLNPTENSVNPIVEPSTKNSLGRYRLQYCSGSSSSRSGMPNNAMYNPRNSVPIGQDPRINAMSNTVMYNPRTPVPVGHVPRINAVPNNVMYNPRNPVPVGHAPMVNAMPNNVMYSPRIPVAVGHDPRVNNAMPNANKLVFSPLLHDPGAAAMINNVMLKECGAASETFFYANPSMQPNDHDQATYYQMSHMFPPMHPSDPLADLYRDIDEYEIMKGKKQRF